MHAWAVTRRERRDLQRIRGSTRTAGTYLPTTLLLHRVTVRPDPIIPTATPSSIHASSSYHPLRPTTRARRQGYSLVTGWRRPAAVLKRRERVKKASAYVSTWPRTQSGCCTLMGHGLRAYCLPACGRITWMGPGASIRLRPTHARAGH